MHKVAIQPEKSRITSGGTYKKLKGSHLLPRTDSIPTYQYLMVTERATIGSWSNDDGIKNY